MWRVRFFKKYNIKRLNYEKCKKILIAQLFLYKKTHKRWRKPVQTHSLNEKDCIKNKESLMNQIVFNKIRLFHHIIVMTVLLGPTANALAMQQSHTVIQSGHSSPFVIENNSPSKNGNITHALLLFYQSKNSVSCTCGRYDSAPMSSKTMITWNGQIPFKKNTATKFVQIVHPNFPATAGCMQVALYGNEKPTPSKAISGWFLDSKKSWPCFGRGIKKTIPVIYYPTPT
jgi:hypothetical protein